MANLIDSFNSIESNPIAALITVGSVIGAFLAFIFLWKFLEYFIEILKMHKKVVTKIFFSLVVIILIACLTDLFIWKPSRIRKNCAEFAIQIKVSRIANNRYRECLVQNGMKPESLFVNID